ncbi:beta-glucosidase family 9 [Chitinophaga jiangningensis]|uniref:Beta-glucosidase family 9 n=1 Tax=Chitinophaga jiangningensis TaxID=1419482 RepID=A0A1M7L5J5_9BACT|nr:glycoside hydrolase family 9 protein [Chitinophaga jiangningensis]SHM72747.1 beta-glucosidase family 9 [Chitinophaga jiangningensis]
MPFLSFRLLFCIGLLLPFTAFSQSVRVLINHVGYEVKGPKRAILQSQSRGTAGGYQLLDVNNQVVFSGKLAPQAQTVDNWQLYFREIDFSAFVKPGKYRLRASLDQQDYTSELFEIGTDVLERQTLSDVIYYFKGQRSSGLLDAADRHVGLLNTRDTVDAHGGWYDATGDYGKHLSHLSFSTYFNPQQISLTVWSLLNTYELLNARPGSDFRQFKRRVLDEAMYGADYLARVQVKDGSFFRSVSAPGPGKRAVDRVIRPEEKNYRIKENKDQSFTSGKDNTAWQSYQVSFRSGGGIAIAALAKAATYDTSGEYTNAQYLDAAKRAFAYLEKNNPAMTNDGKENIVDDYCALAAATALYEATKEKYYQEYAAARAKQLTARLQHWKQYKDFWRADDQDRPFFHPSDAGLPAVTLMKFYPYAAAAQQKEIRAALQRSFAFEAGITAEVVNPFGYSRQLVQDTAGVRRSSFFFPHGSEAAPWWQGENARLGSIATAARMAARFFADDPKLAASLRNYATNQLNWILGLNPYDACMMQGTGHNNPAYGFFGTFEYTNAPGGIVNGITSGFTDEHGIAFNLSYKTTGKDDDWRWAEQWLPHAAWYMWAVAEGN